MKIVCGWCGEDMGRKAPLDLETVTHGICAICEKDLEKEIEEPSGSKIQIPPN